MNLELTGSLIISDIVWQRDEVCLPVHGNDISKSALGRAKHALSRFKGAPIRNGRF